MLNLAREGVEDGDGMVKGDDGQDSKKENYLDDMIDATPTATLWV